MPPRCASSMIAVRSGADGAHRPASCEVVQAEGDDEDAGVGDERALQTPARPFRRVAVHAGVHHLIAMASALQEALQHFGVRLERPQVITGGQAVAKCDDHCSGDDRARLACSKYATPWL
jgi:hypothetical protein